MFGAEPSGVCLCVCLGYIWIYILCYVHMLYLTIFFTGPTYIWTFNLKTKAKPSKWVLAGVAMLLQI